MRNKVQEAKPPYRYQSLELDEVFRAAIRCADEAWGEVRGEMEVILVPKVLFERLEEAVRALAARTLEVTGGHSTNDRTKKRTSTN